MSAQNPSAFRGPTAYWVCNGILALSAMACFIDFALMPHSIVLKSLEFIFLIFILVIGADTSGSIEKALFFGLATAPGILSLLAAGFVFGFKKAPARFVRFWAYFTVVFYGHVVLLCIMGYRL